MPEQDRSASRILRIYAYYWEHDGTEGSSHLRRKDHKMLRRSIDPFRGYASSLFALSCCLTRSASVMVPPSGTDLRTTLESIVLLVLGDLESVRNIENP